MYHGWICFNVMICSEQQRKQDRGCQRDIWDPSWNIKVGFSCPGLVEQWLIFYLSIIERRPVTGSAIGCSSSLASPLSGCSIQDWTQRPLPYVSGSVNRLKKQGFSWWLCLPIPPMALWMVSPGCKSGGSCHNHSRAEEGEQCNPAKQPTMKVETISITLWMIIVIKTTLLRGKRKHELCISDTWHGKKADTVQH